MGDLKLYLFRGSSITQSDYDYQTAEYMFKGGRYVYTVFMAHLAIEKALKGLFQKKFTAIPPRTHSLIYFVNKTQTSPPETVGKFLVKLDQASIATRYPEDLMKLQSVYTQAVAKEILTQTKEALSWARKMF